MTNTTNMTNTTDIEDFAIRWNNVMQGLRDLKESGSTFHGVFNSEAQLLITCDYKDSDDITEIFTNEGFVIYWDPAIEAKETLIVEF